ncbi:hypothetical protein C9382_17630 [Pseudomonas aylmerensis]|uniref:Uncharacterized protein n=1 Tax=Pseudomonas aylmerensis TaxID=1869229 RepID=A0A2T4FUC7_9PSED|nr:hypothetical protein BBG20_10670 [Pseudomonas aylmerensis]PTC27033.1 hypothetical protein C9382_17630 [Pseudomonas aylmerensis]
MANRVGSAQNERHVAYGWSWGEQAGTSGHRESPLLLLTAGLLPAVGAILDGEAFSQLSLGKQLMEGRYTVVRFTQRQCGSWQASCHI